MLSSHRAGMPAWAGSLLVILGLAFVLRAFIAWVWVPTSGFFLDLDLNADWVDALMTDGWGRFYRADAGYFIDYPPAYFVILTLVGWLNAAWVALTGGPPITIGLLKLPPILADVGIAALAAPIGARVGGPRTALPAAAVIAFNPALILDSAVYGQNDSVGAVVVMAAIVCLARGWTEVAAAAAVLATLVKFQFGFIVPVVLVVGLRRHLGSRAGWWRVPASLAAGLLALAVVAAPFGLSLYDATTTERSLWHRFTAASEAFPGVTQNAFNLWMSPVFDILRHEANGITAGSVVDDSRAVLAIGSFGVTWQLLGGVLFLAACLPCLWLLTRRTDTLAVVLAAFAIAVALYVFPTRIHERYLVPALAVGVPLAVLPRLTWRIPYAILSVVAFLAIYFVYTLPNLNRHHPRDAFINDSALSPTGIYLLSAAAVASCAWLLWTVVREARAAPEVAPTDAQHGVITGGPRWLGRARPAWRWHPFEARVPWGLVLAGVSLAAAAVAARVTFGVGGWLWNLDLPKVHYPLAAFFSEALADGRLPLWNDRLGLGFPLYAEGQIGAFYPPNWLIFLLEPMAAMDLSRLLHLAVGGTGAGLLALCVSGSRPGSIVAALVTVLGGAIVAKLEWWNLVAAYAWMPWVLLPLAGRRALQARDILVAGTLWGVQALTGHPNTWLLTGTAALVLIIRAPLLRATGQAAWFGILGVAIGAVQLLPTLLLQRISVRSLGLSADDLFTSAATPFDLIGLGFVNAFVRGGGDGAWDFASTWYPDGIFALLEAHAYVGLPAVALAGLGLVTRRARRWLVVGGVMLAIAVVAAFRPEWWQAMPVLNGLRSPVRSYLVLTLVVAVLAAIGTSRLGRDRLGGRPAVIAMAVVTVAFLAVTVAARSVPAAFELLLSWSVAHLDPGAAAATRARAVPALTSPWPIALELVAAAAMGWMAVRPRSRRSVAATVILVLVPLALLSPAANLVRDRSAHSFAGTEFIQRVAAEAPHRVLVLQPPGYWEGMPDQLAAAGIADVDMFSSLNLLEGDLLTRELREADADGVVRRLVGIDVVVTVGGACPGRRVEDIGVPAATMCRVDDALSPPYWIPADAATPVAGSGTPPTVQLDRSMTVGAAVPASLVAHGPARTEIDVDAPGAGWVYLDRAWWHGWRATLDGRDVPIRSGAGGQLVEVPAGRHRLEVALVPWDALVGLLAGVVVLAGSVVAERSVRLRRTTGWWWPTFPRG